MKIAEFAGSTKESAMHCGKPAVCWLTLTVLLLGAAIGPAAAYGQGTLSHSVNSTAIVPGSVACPTGPTSFWRVYDTSFFGVAMPIQIDSVSFGVELATGLILTDQIVTINLYTDSDLDPTTGLVLAYSELGLVNDLDSGTVVTIPHADSPAVPAGRHHRRRAGDRGLRRYVLHR